jgi:CheY-like chemotaxis protein
MHDEYRPVVLVVDDERLIADTLVLVLNHHGYAATACYSGSEAIAVLSELNPDILISDVVMGEVSGVEVAIAAHRMLPNCKVLLISGNATTQNLLEEADLEGYKFNILAKPVHPVELMAQIGKPGSPS